MHTQLKPPEVNGDLELHQKKVVIGPMTVCLWCRLTKTYKELIIISRPYPYGYFGTSNTIQMLVNISLLVFIAYRSRLT